MITFYTIGFTKKSAETFFNLLKANHTSALIDVRINNVSQLAGFAYQNLEKKDYPHYRINFGYNNCQYDLPITDPDHIQKLIKQTIKIGRKENLFATCSLGMEHEGDHVKIAAAIFETELTKTIEIAYEHITEDIDEEDQPPASNNSDWFASYNNELEDLLAQKKEIENRTTTLRTQIRQAENPELYSKYCKIDFRTASIRIETKHKNQ